MRYTTTAGSVLSAASSGCGLPAASADLLLSAARPSCGLPTASADLLLPATASCIQRDAASSGLLLPATSGKSSVTGRSRARLGPFWVKAYATYPTVVFRPTSSFQARSERMVLSDVDGLSYRECRAQAECFCFF